MIHHPDDPRVKEAQQKDIFKVADDLQISGLTKPYGAGRNEKSGPCPIVGCGGKDRFSLNRTKGLFNCRHCGGGDVIRLVERVRGIDFKAALDWLCGPSQVLTKAEIDQRNAASEKEKAKQDAYAEKARQSAIRMAQATWSSAAGYPTAMVGAYLALRGITLRRLPDCLRFHPDLAYMEQIDGEWVQVHSGPAMLAAIVAPNGRLQGCHRTWFSPDAPQGKVRIIHPKTGEVLARKKSLGSVKGNVIRLTGAHHSDTLVMGEGIETTLTAGLPKALPGAMFWAGIDLGNMGGRRASGPGLKFAGIPDMEDARAFLPPPFVTRLVFLMDGDSEPRHTRSTLESGLRRAMAHRARAGGPALQAQIVAAPSGMDFNDLLQSETVPAK